MIRPFTIAAFLTVPLAAAAATPNILFAVADDWGVHAGAYGTAWVRTPHFDRVARDGILFSRAYTPNAKCAPSRACMITGRNSWQLREAANHWSRFPTEFKTWGEALGEHGWHVGHTNKGWAPGIANDAQGRPRQLIGKAWNEHRTKPPTPHISPNDYAANFAAFLDAAPDGKPWVFWYGSGEPHRGYEFKSAIRQGRRTDDVDRVPGYWPDNETVRTDMLDYAFEVEHFDSHLGRMITTLQQRGLLDNTLIIVTSDHGMPFPRCKGSAYGHSNHVPFAAMWKNGIRGKGRTVTDYVSLVDLAPTFIELAGLSWEDTGMASTPGKSLTPVFTSGKSGAIDPARDHVLIGKERHDIGRPDDVGYPIRGIATGGMLYLENREPDRWPSGNPETGYPDTDGSPTKTAILEARRENRIENHWQLCFGKRPAAEFYNLEKDPDCLTNLAANPAVAGRRDDMRRRMHAELTAQQDPRMDGRGHLFDEYPYADAARRNFHARMLAGEKIETRWLNPGDFEKDPVSPSTRMDGQKPLETGRP